MKRINILYWIFTGLFAAFMIFTAIPNILSDGNSVELIHKTLGYPLYFIPFIGIAKVIGSITLVVPINYRLKEWAYAGLFFDLIAATYSLISIGTPFSDWVFMLPSLLVGAASYYFHLQRTAKS